MISSSYSHMQFFLLMSSDFAGNYYLRMASAVVVDSIGIHYLSNGTDILLDKNDDPSIKALPIIESDPKNPTYIINSSLSMFKNRISISDANDRIGYYSSNNSTNVSATSFLINSNTTDFSRYLATCQAKGAVYLQMYLAEDQGRLTLIATTIDGNGYHYFIKDATGKYYTMEHCIPCPICDNVINDPGYYIMTPQ